MITKCGLDVLKIKNVGRYMFAECKDFPTDKYTRSRLFIKRLNDLDDIYYQQGMHDIFTLSDTVLDKGIYIVKILSYRYDKNNNIICETVSITKVSAQSFEIFKSTNSPITKCILKDCNLFIDDISLYYYDGPMLNYYNLVENVPELSESHNLYRDIFDLYVKKGYDFLIEAESYLSAPFGLDKCVDKLSWEHYNSTLILTYGDKYPILCKKITNTMRDLTNIKVKMLEYISRQLKAYRKEFKEEPNTDDESDVLEAVEKILKWREDQKELKRKRKER